MYKKAYGFTIVELLIVIVVIAILAAISVVAYTGIQNRANDAAVQSDLRNFGMRAEEYRASEGAYPAGSNGTGGPVGLGVVKITKAAYDVTSGKNNIYYCAGETSEGVQRVGIVAVSKSGNIYRYQTGSGVGTWTGSWTNLQASMYPQFGLVSGHTYSLARNHNDGNWRAWVE